MASSIGVASSSYSESDCTGKCRVNSEPCRRDLTHGPPSPAFLLSHIERWQASINSPPRQSDSSPKSPAPQVSHSRAHSESLDGKASVETRVGDCQGKERAQSEPPSKTISVPSFSLLQISDQHVSCPLPLSHRADSYLKAFQGTLDTTLSEHFQRRA
jgi:hypothetical protein